MPLIEEVATKRLTATPGWAYVPDTGYDPSKAPIVPTGSRQRGARNTAAPSAREIPSGKQQSRIHQHIASLQKDNHRDVQIVVPNRARDVAGRGVRGGQMTAGVKKILQSQKTLTNHLVDEEAAISNQTHGASGPVETSGSGPGSGSGTPRASHGSAAKGKRASLTAKVASQDRMDLDSPAAEAVSQPPQDLPAAPSASQQHPLLRTNCPSMPSQGEIDALLARPPLRYHDAAAAPTASSAPPRQFCEICGYWGRVRCMKCGMRVCDLECKLQHDEAQCQRFWA